MSEITLKPRARHVSPMRDGTTWIVYWHYTAGFGRTLDEAIRDYHVDRLERQLKAAEQKPMG